MTNIQVMRWQKVFATDGHIKEHSVGQKLWLKVGKKRLFGQDKLT